MSGAEKEPYFGGGGGGGGGGGRELFHQVIALSRTKEHEWDDLITKAPLLPRGWYELSRLDPADRIEFTRGFWLSKLPFVSTKNIEGIENFFNELETIEIYLTQVEPGLPFEVHMIYVLEHESGYFQGSPPASNEELDIIKQQFSHLSFPADYLAFLGIHNGFCKYTDTGLIKTKEIARVYRHFQDLLAHEDLIRPDGEMIEPKSLIPFYESFGLHCYQCFYIDWYIENEMGNVYFSEHDRTISNFLDHTRLEDNLAFPSFLSWLVFYLEDIWHL